MVIDWETNAGKRDGEEMKTQRNGTLEGQIPINKFFLQIDFMKEREIDGKSY